MRLRGSLLNELIVSDNRPNRKTSSFQYEQIKKLVRDECYAESFECETPESLLQLWIKNSTVLLMHSDSEVIKFILFTSEIQKVPALIRSIKLRTQLF